MAKGAQKTVAAEQTELNWVYVGIFCLVVALIFFMPFLGPIALSAVFASLLFPLFTMLSRHMNIRIAASLTMIASVLMFAIPLIFLGIMLINQATALINTLEHAEYKPGSPLYDAVHTIGKSLSSAFSASDIEQAQKSIHSFVSNTIPQAMNEVVNVLLGFASSIPQIMTSVIVYAFMFTTFLLHHKSIKKFIHAASPFSQEENTDYFQKAGMIVTASLKGQFVISFTTAVSSALLLFLLGLQPYFIPLTILFTILGMIPLGSGIVVIPVALFAMISGDFWPGFWVLLIYLVFICNIDTVLRPRLIPKKSGMLPALTVLSTFCGIYYFGLMGIVYGPLIVILLITTAQIYLARQKEQRALALQ